MKTNFRGWMVASLAATCVASSVGCYSYPPPNYSSNYQQDSKGGVVEQAPVAPPQPRYVGVDPGLVVAGVAAAGILGYAIGDHHHHNYYGPRYYRPVPYHRGYYGHGYHR